MRLSLLLLLALAASACDSGEGSSIYDPDAPTGAAPVIASVLPEGVVLAGIDEIVIQGQNFSATPSHNLVYFADGAGAGAPGEVVAASPTELRVKVPNLPNGALRVSVSVRGAQNRSNAVALPLVSAILPFGDLDPNPGAVEEPSAIVGDGTGSLYFSLSSEGNPKGIKRFAPDGTREAYVASRIVWNDFALNAGVLYGVQNVQALFRIPSAGAEQVVMPVLASGVRISTITSDGSGIWAAGSAGSPTRPLVGNIYRFDLAGNATPTSFPGSVTDLVVFDGYLYVSGVRSEPVRQAKVWRLPIQGDGTLGPEEVVYDVEADQPGLRPSALALAADGTVFVGIAPPLSNSALAVEHPVIRVAPDGTAAPLYPGILPSPVQALAWGEGSTLYVVRSRLVTGTGASATVVPAALFAVETRQQGAP